MRLIPTCLLLVLVSFSSALSGEAAFDGDLIVQPSLIPKAIGYFGEGTWGAAALKHDEQFQLLEVVADIKSPNFVLTDPRVISASGESYPVFAVTADIFFKEESKLWARIEDIKKGIVPSDLITYYQDKNNNVIAWSLFQSKSSKALSKKGVLIVVPTKTGSQLVFLKGNTTAGFLFKVSKSSTLKSFEYTLDGEQKRIALLSKESTNRRK